METKSLVVYVTFPSAYWALKGEKHFLEKGIKARLCPVPRQLSSSCGYALEVWNTRHPEVTRLLEEAGIENEGVYA